MIDKKLKDKLLKTAIYLNHNDNKNNDYDLIFDIYNSETFECGKREVLVDDEFNYPEQVSLDNKVQEFLVKLLDNKTEIYDLYWPAIAEAHQESHDLSKNLSIPSLIEILKSLKKLEVTEKRENSLYEEFKEFIKLNGLLKPSSTSIILNRSDIYKGVVGKAIANLDRESIRKINHEDFQNIFHSLLVIEGLSPRTGGGRDKIIDKKNIPSEEELEFLRKEGLSLNLREHIGKYEELGQISEDRFNEDLEHLTNKRNFGALDQHIEQIKVLIVGLERFYKNLFKVTENFSYDQSYLHHNSLPFIIEFRLFSKKENSNKVKKNLESALKKFNSKAKNNKDIEIKTDPVLNFIANKGGTILIDVLLKSIFQLIKLLDARLKILEMKRGSEEKISIAEVSLLSGMSTDRTIKNELTRRDSEIYDPRRNKNDGLNTESIYKWLSSKKRRITFKEVVHSEATDTEISYSYLKEIYDNFIAEYTVENSKDSNEEKVGAFKENRSIKPPALSSAMEPTSQRIIRRSNQMRGKQVTKAKMNLDLLSFLTKEQEQQRKIESHRKYYQTEVDKLIKLLDKNKPYDEKPSNKLLNEFYTFSKTFDKIN